MENQKLQLYIYHETYIARGLVTRRHNEVRDAFGDLASLVWSPVVKEPVVHDGSAGADILIADL